MFYLCFPLAEKGENMRENGRIGKARRQKGNKSMITTRIVYDRKCITRKSPKREAAVSIRVTDGRKSRYVNTGVKVLRTEWRDGEVVNRPDANELNERVLAVRARVESEVNRSIEEGLSVDMVRLRGECSENADCTPVLTWIAEQTEILNVGEGTRAHYRTLQLRLAEFGRLNRWHDVTTERIYEWDAWLRGLQSENGRVLCDDSVLNYHKTLRAMLSRAVKFGKIDRSPYEALRGEFRRSAQERTDYLTEAEMDAVSGLELEPGSWAAKARDLFCFQMWTGLAYSDAQRFDIRDYRQVDGMWRSVGSRVKTGVPYVSSLLPPAVEVLERYGMKVPKLSNQKYNQMLKVIGMMAGIKMPLHSHMARHSFATFALRHGVKIENLSRMLGHTNISVTQRYAKVLAASVNEEFDKLSGVIEEKEAGIECRENKQSKN